MVRRALVRQHSAVQLVDDVLGVFVRNRGNVLESIIEWGDDKRVIIGERSLDKVEADTASVYNYVARNTVYRQNSAISMKGRRLTWIEQG